MVNYFRCLFQLLQESKETRLKKEKAKKKTKSRENASPSASPNPSSAQYSHSRTNSTSSEYSSTERLLLRTPTLNTINQVSGHFKGFFNILLSLFSVDFLLWNYLVTTDTELLIVKLDVHNAAFTGNLERLRKLLDMGADINDRAEDKSTPLHHGFDFV